MNITPTISLVELLYTVPTVLGALVFAYLTADSLRTLWSVLIDGINGRVRSASLNEVVTDVIGLYALTGFSVIGILALFAPPPPASATVRQVVAGWVFLSVTVALVGHGWWRFRRNRAGLRRIRQRAALVADVSGEDEEDG